MRKQQERTAVQTNHISLRDVMFLCHPKPRNKTQEKLFKKIANKELKTPDTWEVALSSGEDKRTTWERLITEGKLGALAFLRNLRNMKDVGVDHNIIRNGLANLSNAVLLPINYLAAFKYAPEFSKEIEKLMHKGFANLQKLPGKTVFIVDVSGSMNSHISNRSEFKRLDVASMMAIAAMNLCESMDVYCTAGDDYARAHQTRKIKYPSNSFKLLDEINSLAMTMGGGGIFTRQCLEYIRSDINYQPDRIIVFSDSQDCDLLTSRTPNPFGKANYIVDVSANKHGIDYKGVWTAEISGWSDHFLSYIMELEGVSTNFEEE